MLSAHDFEELEKAGAVGEICGRFYDKNGRECLTPWRDRVLSIGLDQIRRIPQVIAVIAGGNRAAAISAAIRGGLVKALVIDEVAASFLLGASIAPSASRVRTPPKSRTQAARISPPITS